MSFPLPTGHELLISAEVLIFLYPLRLVLDTLEGDVRKARRRIIHKHVHEAHKKRLRKCTDADCIKLQGRSGLVPQPQAVPEQVPGQQQ